MVEISCIPDVGPDGEHRAGHCTVGACNLEDMLCIYLAGGIAEAMHRHLPPPSLDRDDSDMHKARALAHRIDRHRANLVLRRAETRTRLLLRNPTLYRGIMALAWELELAKRLDGEEARHIFTVAPVAL